MSATIDLDPRYLDDEDLIAAGAREAWLGTARSNQQLPIGEWDTCIWIAGRFFGKTRCIVEPMWWEAYRVPGIRIHVVSPTLGDVRRTMFEGESGFLAKMPNELIKSYNKTDKEIYLKNGSLIAGFACVEEAERLRGPQCHHLAFDEAAAADRPAGNLEAAWRVAALGCRLPLPDGSPSRKLIATTPRPIPFLKRLIKRAGVIVIRGTSYENFAHISKAAQNEVAALDGTDYGRQEIYGEFIDEGGANAIIKRHWIKLWPMDKDKGVHKPLPVMSFILESYDTASSEADFDLKKQETDPSASIVLGVFNMADNFTEAERKKLKLRSRYGVLLLDAWAEHLGLPELLDKARKQHRQKWGPLDRARRADVVLIEDKSSGPGLRQMMARWGVPVWPMKPRVSKRMRLDAVSPLIMQGMFWVPESTRPDREGLHIGWADQLLEQLCAYAGEGSVEHDDLLDSVTQALTYLKDNGMLLATPEEQFADLEEKIDFDRAEAKRMYEAEKRVERSSPYG